MKYATFINFTEKAFTGYWNGRAYTFQPGQKKEHLNSAIAAHFAKHLSNQVLTDAGKEQYCSPKKPEEVPQFMEVFNKALFIEGGGQEVDAETGLSVDGKQNINEIGMNVRVIPRQPITTDPYDANAQPQVGPGTKAQIVGEAEDEESSFEGV